MSERTVDDVYRAGLLFVAMILSFQSIMFVYIVSPNGGNLHLAIPAIASGAFALSAGCAGYKDGYNRRFWAALGVTADE